jgi:hypothetical protein
MKALKYGDWVKDERGEVWAIGKHGNKGGLYDLQRVKEDGITEKTWRTRKNLTKLPEPICKILSDSIKFKDGLYTIHLQGEDDVKDK